MSLIAIFRRLLQSEKKGQKPGMLGNSVRTLLQRYWEKCQFTSQYPGWILFGLHYLSWATGTAGPAEHSALVAQPTCRGDEEEDWE